jgi:DNA end-binding protein Ku
MSTATARRRKAPAKARRPAEASDSGPKPKRPRGPYRATKREAGEEFGAAGRPLWSGSISFGLVNIPVRLFTAVREQRVAFHLLHDQDKARLRRRLVCPADGEEVHPEHVVRGYEVAKDQYVVVRDEELEGCAPEKTRTIEITDFVELAAIDPIYFDRPYYVLPQAGASKPYRLLAEAMTRSGRVGLARIVMHEREHLAALRAVDGLLCLSTMHFGAEVVPTDEIEDLPGNVKPADRELKAAAKVIESLAGDFDPADYRDAYRQCVRKMVEEKAAKEQVVTAPEPAADDAPDKKPARGASNLMEALEASLAHARGQQTSGKRRKSA